MSIFSKILSKLGFGHADAVPAPAAASPSPAATPAATPTAAAPSAAPAAPQAISAVDVTAKLEQLASANPEKLNWRVSIVDLLKLLGLDSSLAARKELATELGYSGAKDGSAEMNIWLHKAVMRELEKSGGRVPASLKD